MSGRGDELWCLSIDLRRIFSSATDDLLAEGLEGKLEEREKRWGEKVGELW